MKRRRALVRVFSECVQAGAWLAVTLGAAAQPAGRPYRIGVLGAVPPAAADADTLQLTKLFYETLRERGYVEGRNLVVERRYTEGRAERLPALVAELTRFSLDVLVVSGNAAAQAAKAATKTIPIVMLLVSDPVGAGLVTSLARPGANLTGTTDVQEDLTLKWLELLKAVIPRISRIAILTSEIGGPDPARLAAIRDAQAASARGMGVSISRFELQAPSDLDAAAKAIARELPDALFLDHRPLSYILRRVIAEFALEHRLPTIGSLREQARAGILMTYGPSAAWQVSTAASYVDRILKGAKPADLPIEQPTIFDLAINLKTARALGLTIPQSVLLHADEVIE
jgi:putative tryptophan/tyrosine transport system substrate-binding protein